VISDSHHSSKRECRTRLGQAKGGDIYSQQSSNRHKIAFLMAFALALSEAFNIWLLSPANNVTLIHCHHMPFRRFLEKLPTSSDLKKMTMIE
jgi:hypothetical protein